MNRRRRAPRLGAPPVFTGPLNGSSESPEQVLQRRYANGEIDHATYQPTLAELKG